MIARWTALWLASGCVGPRIQTPSPSAGASTAGAETQAASRARAASLVPDDGSNRIVNLFDAFGALPPGAEHAFGFSVLVRYAGKTILFDAGSSADVLEKNVKAMGIDLRQVDFAVASHSHFDHTSGFDYLVAVNPHVRIYFPDDIFWGAPFEYDAKIQRHPTGFHQNSATSLANKRASSGPPVGASGRRTSNT
jgi:glyoxylase-like metal-dependent hydrolase (beta-lactamase superfamily II)